MLNRGFGRSIYFPNDMEEALERVKHLEDNGVTKSFSVFVCDAIKEKLDRLGESA